MLAFGRDATGGIPGFRSSEMLALRLGGCTALAARFWIDDHLPHEITLAIAAPEQPAAMRSSTSSPQNVYLPVSRK